MTSVARQDVEYLPHLGRSGQDGTDGRPRHDWSMRLLGSAATSQHVADELFLFGELHLQRTLQVG